MSEETKPSSKYLRIMLDHLDTQWQRCQITSEHYEHEARRISAEPIEAEREGR